MAFTRRFSFHLTPEVSDNQIKAVLEAYNGEQGEAPTGWYQKSGDIVQVEIMMTSGANIATVQEKLQRLFQKVTAGGVFSAIELGPTLPGEEPTPLPETNAPSLLYPLTGNPEESFSQTIKNVFSDVKTLTLLAAVIVIGIVILRVKK